MPGIKLPKPAWKYDVIWRFPEKMVVFPICGLFTMENSMKMDDLGVNILGNLHIWLSWRCPPNLNSSHLNVDETCWNPVCLSLVQQIKHDYTAKLPSIFGCRIPTQTLQFAIGWATRMTQWRYWDRKQRRWQKIRGFEMKGFHLRCVQHPIELVPICSN